MTDTEPTETDAFDREAVRSASRIAVAALALVSVLYLFTLLPGVDRLIPLTPVTFAAVASAVVTAAVVALLLYAAPKTASLARAALHRTDAAAHVERIAENGGATAYWLVVLAAVLVAHRGLAGAVVPLLDGFAWAYDAAFLVASFVPLVFVVARLTVTVDPLSELVADRVVDSDSAADTDSATASESTTGSTPATGSDGDSTRIDLGDSHMHWAEDWWGVDDDPDATDEPGDEGGETTDDRADDGSTDDATDDDRAGR